MPVSQAESIRRITRSILNLPTLPTVAARLIEAVDNPRTSAQMLGQLVTEDQVLTAKILKMSNSAYYGFPQEITSVNLAIVVLGFENIKEVSLGVSVLNTFKGVRGSTRFDLAAFWDHSLAVGFGARLFSKKFFPSSASEAFVAGLLHDIGKVILVQYLPDEFEKVLEEASESGRALNLVEQEHLSTHHGEVGFWLAEKWSLPEALRMAIRFHHHPRQSPSHRELVTSVAVSNLLCRGLNAGDSGNPAPAELDEDLLEHLSDMGIFLEKESLDILRLELEAELEESASLRRELSK